MRTYVGARERGPKKARGFTSGGWSLLLLIQRQVAIAVENTQHPNPSGTAIVRDPQCRLFDCGVSVCTGHFKQHFGRRFPASITDSQISDDAPVCLYNNIHLVITVNIFYFNLCAQSRKITNITSFQFNWHNRQFVNFTRTVYIRSSTITLNTQSIIATSQHIMVCLASQRFC